MARSIVAMSRYVKVLRAEQPMPCTVSRWEQFGGAWHHVAITYDDKGGVWLSIDGVSVDDSKTIG